MEELGINMTAILVATVANFILGFLWYTPLFGKAWAKEMGFNRDVKLPKGALAKGMIFMVTYKGCIASHVAVRQRIII